MILGISIGGISRGPYSQLSQKMTFCHFNCTSLWAVLYPDGSNELLIGNVLLGLSIVGEKKRISFKCRYAIEMRGKARDLCLREQVIEWDISCFRNRKTETKSQRRWEQRGGRSGGNMRELELGNLKQEHRNPSSSHHFAILYFIWMCKRLLWYLLHSPFLQPLHSEKALFCQLLSSSTCGRIVGIFTWRQISSSC